MIIGNITKKTILNKDKNIKAQLIKMSEKDDKQAFSFFFNYYYVKLLRFAHLFVPSIHQAEDVVSEVLIRLLKKRKELFKIENFEGYLFLAVKNEALNNIKLSKRNNNLVSIENENDCFSSDFVDPYTKLVEEELRNLIYCTIEKLPPKRRMVYKLIKDEGLKYKEVAELLDISERTVEVHLKIAVKELRETIKTYLEDKQPQSSMQIMQMIQILLLAI